MELSPEMLFLLGILTMVIVWLLKEAFVKRGKEVPKYVYNIVLGVVALLLALGFSPVSLPEFPAHDGTLIGVLAAALSFLGSLLPVLTALVGFAKIIYEDLLERVLKGLGEALRSKIAGSDIG
jgi:small-conductance mechanosensitive channel